MIPRVPCMRSKGRSLTVSDSSKVQSKFIRNLVIFIKSKEEWNISSTKYFFNDAVEKSTAVCLKLIQIIHHRWYFERNVSILSFLSRERWRRKIASPLKCFIATTKSRNFFSCLFLIQYFACPNSFDSAFHFHFRCKRSYHLQTGCSSLMHSSHLPKQTHPTKASPRTPMKGWIRNLHDHDPIIHHINIYLLRYASTQSPQSHSSASSFLSFFFSSILPSSHSEESIHQRISPLPPPANPPSAHRIKVTSRDGLKSESFNVKEKSPKETKKIDDLNWKLSGTRWDGMG